jgi:hypothetical protein
MASKLFRFLRIIQNCSGIFEIQKGPKPMSLKCYVVLMGLHTLEHLHGCMPRAKWMATPSALIILMTHRSTSNQESLQGLPRYKP